MTSKLVALVPALGRMERAFLQDNVESFRAAVNECHRLTQTLPREVTTESLQDAYEQVEAWDSKLGLGE